MTNHVPSIRSARKAKHRQAYDGTMVVASEVLLLGAENACEVPPTSESTEEEDSHKPKDQQSSSQGC